MRDKLDVLRVNLETPLEDIYNVTTKELRTSEVTPEVMEAVKGHHTVLRSKRNHLWITWQDISALRLNLHIQKAGRF